MVRGWWSLSALLLTLVLLAELQGAIAGRSSTFYLQRPPGDVSVICRCVGFNGLLSYSANPKCFSIFLLDCLTEGSILSCFPAKHDAKFDIKLQLKYGHPLYVKCYRWHMPKLDTLRST